MRKYLRIILGLFISLSLFMQASNALAQTVFDESRAAQARAVKMPEINFDRDNPYLRDLLTLQKQISLINKMIERENQIQQIRTAMAEIGLFPNLPSPSRDWCEQIPANLSCAYHYPNMYDNFDVDMFRSRPKVIEDTEKEDDDRNDNRRGRVSPPPINPLQAVDIAPVRISDQSAQEREILKDLPMSWTDIRCLGGTCEAVVSPIQEVETEEGTVRNTIKTVRYTVGVGDKLPDGRTVEAISATGVKLRDLSGKINMLEPAPQ